MVVPDAPVALRIVPGVRAAPLWQAHLIQAVPVDQVDRCGIDQAVQFVRYARAGPDDHSKILLRLQEALPALLLAPAHLLRAAPGGRRLPANPEVAERLARHRCEGQQADQLRASDERDALPHPWDEPQQLPRRPRLALASPGAHRVHSEFESGVTRCRAQLRDCARRRLSVYPAVRARDSLRPDARL